MSLTFAEACRFLFPRTGGAGTWSLAPTRALLAELGHPEEQLQVIHVGGTNGKGSVCALVASALTAAGFRTGLYTSPHLVDIRERMLVAGAPVSREAFAMWTGRLRSAIEQTGASFFEATTAIAFADLAARGADIAVVEVGLGGRLDATNVVRPLVSAVISVALEHTDYLGDDLAGIAREKAGIAKPDVPFVVGEPDPALARLLRDAATAAGARLVAVPPEASWEGPLGLAGPFQRRNAAVASAVLDALPRRFRPSRNDRAAGFGAARLPGRFDRHGRWLFDVAHNPAGVMALLDALAAGSLTRPVHAVVGILADKDWEGMIRTLRPGVEAVWLTDPPSAPPGRRLSLASAGKALGDLVTVTADFDAALEAASHGAGTVLVCGSFHTVGDAMARLPGCAPLG